MKPLNSLQELENVWAKKPEGNNPEGETLTQHTWLVLKRLAEHIKLRPFLPGILGFSSLYQCLFWACFLHDFGKACPGFQHSLRSGKRWYERHELYSLLFLDWFEGVGDDEINWIASAVLCHHKDPAQIMVLYDVFDDDIDIFRETANKNISQFSPGVLEEIWVWLKYHSPVWIKEMGLNEYGIYLPALKPLQESLNLITDNSTERLINLLKQTLRFLHRLSRQDSSYKNISVAVRGYMNTADYAASAHSGKLIDAKLPDTTNYLKTIKINTADLHSHQLKSMGSKGTTVLIAPTGSGKTEAALLWALSQSQDSVPSRIFYMLPFQASMNAMYERLLNSGFSGRVGLEHGRSVLSLYKKYLEDDDNKSSAVFKARWAKKLARLSYYPVKILSPYQLFKAVFRLKSYELILCDYYNASVILDEIHAYDPEKTALIFAMAKYLEDNFKARFFVMSATLPELLLKTIDKCLNGLSIIESDEKLYKKFIRHRINIINGEVNDTLSIKQIISKAREGKSVLICCNRVKRAQEVYQTIKQSIQDNAVDVFLLHGRFNGKDRLNIEKKVNEFTGALSAYRKQVILVSTQVVEVSLNIDLDVIFTEPAPLEALIQRFGRINRKMRQTIADVFIFNQPADGQNVYDDALVQKSLEILTENNNKPIKEDRVHEWLNSIYQGEIKTRWEQSFKQNYDNFIYGISPSLYGFNTNLGNEKEFYQAFDTLEVLPAVLKKEYDRLVENDPILASELLVPVRYGQLKYLESVNENNLFIVNAEYSSELGLQL